MSQPISKFAPVFPICLIVCCGGQIRAELKIVSPGAYANTESPASANAPDASGRFQQIFPASDFLSLPANMRTITQYGYRPDGQLTTPLHGMLTTHKVILSTTSVEPGNLDLTFANNVGQDAVVVFDGTNVDWTIQNRGPAGGPKEFDYITFQTPFEYDPSKGNLLMDVSFTYEGDFSADVFSDAGPHGQFIGGDLGGTRANYSQGGFVTQFTVVPEPSTITLFTMAGMVGAFVAWRKRKRT